MKLIRSSAIFLAVITVIFLSGCDMLQQLINVGTGRNHAVESRTQSDAQAQMEKIEADGADYGFRALQTNAERRVYCMLDAYVSKGIPQMFVINNDGTLDKMTAIFELYKSDHPEVFWINDQYSYEYVTYSDYTEITPLFSVEREQLGAAMERFEEKIEEICADAPLNGSDYEKELYVNEYLIDNCAYDAEAAQKEDVVSNEQNAYGALVDGKAVDFECEIERIQADAFDGNLASDKVFGIVDDIAPCNHGGNLETGNDKNCKRGDNDGNDD